MQEISKHDHTISCNTIRPPIFSLVEENISFVENTYSMMEADTSIDGHPSHIFNPHAKVFISRNRRATHDDAIMIITAIIMAIVFLLVLFLMLNSKTKDNIDMNPKDTFRKIKHDNPNKIIIAHLNINSIRSKFEFLKELISNNIDILLISETKLDETFPTGQFLMNGYQSPLRFDRNDKGGGLLLYFRDHIPCKKIILEFNPVIEAIAIEINLKKRKWLLIGSYNPHKDMIVNHLNSIGKELNNLCLKYENFILMGDFNSEMQEDSMNVFCTTYNFKNLVKELTCVKNIENPSCIDLILTNKPLYFQTTAVIATGISDFHKLTVTILKSSFHKQEPNIFNDRNYKKFNNENFRNDILYEISNKGFHNLSCEEFENLFL